MLREQPTTRFSSLVALPHRGACSMLLPFPVPRIPPEPGLRCGHDFHPAPSAGSRSCHGQGSLRACCVWRLWASARRSVRPRRPSGTLPSSIPAIQACCGRQPTHWLTEGAASAAKACTSRKSAGSGGLQVASFAEPRHSFEIAHGERLQVAWTSVRMRRQSASAPWPLQRRVYYRMDVVRDRGPDLRVAGRRVGLARSPTARRRHRRLGGASRSASGR